MRPSAEANYAQTSRLIRLNASGSQKMVSGTSGTGRKLGAQRTGLLGSVGCSRSLSAESSRACGRNFGQRALSIGCTRELARRSSTVMNVDLSALFCSGIICHAEDAILEPEKCDRAVTT
ncbi:hypothetical protein Q8A67_024629 [Cirrhinus molitorella]|uniref:Uncharacterized protein n=1 Tax=Cirrhinus molitorella TaxID=172907 RepID=A0AA88P4Z7_9TELE|nr:hypothetical protein Q8A67_024629 [Cirrhinus molitorella]